MSKSIDPSPDFGPESVDETDLAPRDSNILHQIREEGLTVFTFDGLRRLLGLHQETLSRVLDRLEDAGLVEKVDEGYRLLPDASEIVAQPLSSGSTRIPVVQALLPEDVDVDDMISALKGRWFGQLRWVGYSQNGDGVVLKWITDEDGVQVDAKISESFLTIEAKAGEEKEISLGIKASHQLLGYISRLYNNRPQRSARFATPIVYYPDSAIVWPGWGS